MGLAIYPYFIIIDTQESAEFKIAQVDRPNRAIGLEVYLEESPVSYCLPR